MLILSFSYGYPASQAAMVADYSILIELIAVISALITVNIAIGIAKMREMRALFRRRLSIEKTINYLVIYRAISQLES